MGLPFAHALRASLLRSASIDRLLQTSSNPRRPIPAPIRHDAAIPRPTGRATETSRPGDNREQHVIGQAQSVEGHGAGVTAGAAEGGDAGHALRLQMGDGGRRTLRGAIRHGADLVAGTRPREAGSGAACPKYRDREKIGLLPEIICYPNRYPAET